MTVEDRLSTLEQEVAAIKLRIAKSQHAESWIEQLAGSMQDFPEFDEVLRLGREEIRKLDQPAIERSDNT